MWGRRKGEESAWERLNEDLDLCACTRALTHTHKHFTQWCVLSEWLMHLSHSSATSDSCASALFLSLMALFRSRMQPSSSWARPVMSRSRLPISSFIPSNFFWYFDFILLSCDMCFWRLKRVYVCVCVCVCGVLVEARHIYSYRKLQGILLVLSTQVNACKQHQNHREYLNSTLRSSISSFNRELSFKAACLPSSACRSLC